MEDDVNLYCPRTLKKGDPHHDAQLARELDTINTHIRRVLGPLPRGGLAKASKRKPLLSNPDVPAQQPADNEQAAAPSIVSP